MIRTFSLIKNILLSTTILGAFWIFSTLSTGMLYAEYDKLWDYRRLHPDLLPSAQTIQISSVGHMNTYVDFSWIQLIQFIGDNIGNGKYLDFTHTILSNITEIDPYFARAYEFDLLLAPFLYPDRTDQEIATYREKIEDILAHGKRGIGYLCDAKKIETIADLPLNNALWERTDLKNPCVSGMIPYYLGYHYNNDLRDGVNSEYYYKIASMQDDAPKSSKFLAILAKTTEGEYLESALSFALIGMSGYDAEPYACRQFASDLAEDLIAKRSVDAVWIKEIENREKQLTDKKDDQIPESYASNNCFESVERSIKQIYISYISELAEQYSPDVDNAKILVTEGIIPHIPTIQSQSGFTVQKVDDIWKFRMNSLN